MKQSRFIEISAEVRYWEDAYLNNEEDTDGKIPLRNGVLWEPIIDLQTGRIQNWPDGVTADIHYKVCDQGEYWLLDESEQRIAKWKGHYVPDDILCVGEDGYGDYIIFKVAVDGTIIGWTIPSLNAEQWILMGEINSTQ
jgi:hypothetical protein